MKVIQYNQANAAVTACRLCRRRRFGYYGFVRIDCGIRMSHRYGGGISKQTRSFKMYRTLQGADGNAKEDMIVLIRDGQYFFIPNEPANRDWQDYLAWVAEGNEAATNDEPERW